MKKKILNVIFIVLEIVLLNQFLYGLWAKTVNKQSELDLVTITLPFLMLLLLFLYIFLRKKLIRDVS